MGSTKDELKLTESGVIHIELESNRVLVYVLKEGNCSILLYTVGVVNVCPFCFNIAELGILNNVPCGLVASCEMVVVYSLPNGQQSVS